MGNSNGNLRQARDIKKNGKEWLQAVREDPGQWKALEDWSRHCEPPKDKTQMNERRQARRARLKAKFKEVALKKLHDRVSSKIVKIGLEVLSKLLTNSQGGLERVSNTVVVHDILNHTNGILLTFRFDTKKKKRHKFAFLRRIASDEFTQALVQALSHDVSATSDKAAIAATISADIRTIMEDQKDYVKDLIEEKVDEVVFHAKAKTDEGIQRAHSKVEATLDENGLPSFELARENIKKRASDALDKSVGASVAPSIVKTMKKVSFSNEDEAAQGPDEEQDLKLLQVDSNQSDDRDPLEQMEAKSEDKNDQVQEKVVETVEQKKGENAVEPNDQKKSPELESGEPTKNMTGETETAEPTNAHIDSSAGDIVESTTDPSVADSPGWGCAATMAMDITDEKAKEETMDEAKVTEAEAQTSETPNNDKAELEKDKEEATDKTEAENPSSEPLTDNDTDTTQENTEKDISPTVTNELPYDEKRNAEEDIPLNSTLKHNATDTEEMATDQTQSFTGIESTTKPTSSEAVSAVPKVLTSQDEEAKDAESTSTSQSLSKGLLSASFKARARSSLQESLSDKESFELSKASLKQTRDNFLDTFADHTKELIVAKMEGLPEKIWIVLDELIHLVNDALIKYEKLSEKNEEELKDKIYLTIERMHSDSVSSVQREVKQTMDMFGGLIERNKDEDDEEDGDEGD